MRKSDDISKESPDTFAVKEIAPLEVKGIYTENNNFVDMTRVSIDNFLNIQLISFHKREFFYNDF